MSDPSAGHVAVVLGTRPEVVKLAEVIRLLGSRAMVVHTGQHFSAELRDSFVDELGIGSIDLSLAVGGSSRGTQIGETVAALDDLFGRSPPAAVVVQGDTNSVVAGALAANARDVPLVHVEAGLRSFDRRMPEEHNRVVTDHLADLCCAPTETNVANLKAEGIAADRILMTGNTVVEAVTRMLPPSQVRRDIQRRLLGETSRDTYVLATFHRPENVDDGAQLAVILEELGAMPVPVLLPLHPRTAAQVRAFRLQPLLDRLHVLPAVGYRDFLALAADCVCLVSDSGGVQEEASVLKRPVLVVRRSTERPEVVGTFARRVLPGPDMGQVVREWVATSAELHAGLAELPSPYGDGRASELIVEGIRHLIATAGSV